MLWIFVTSQVSSFFQRPPVAPFSISSDTTMDIITLEVFLGLILATACTALVRESDVIWFPVDEEDGVFVSTYGEKYRTNWNSRKARFSDDYDTPRMSKQLKNFDEIRELLSNPRDPRLNEIPTVRPKFTTSKNRRNVRVSSMNEFQSEEVVPIGARYRLFLNKNRQTERPTKFIQIPRRRPNRKDKQDLISEIFDIHRSTTESYERDQNWPVRPNDPPEKSEWNQNWPVRPTSDNTEVNQNWPPRPNNPQPETEGNQNWPPRPNNPSPETEGNQNWPPRPNNPQPEISEWNQNWPPRPNRPSPFPEIKPVTEETWEERPSTISDKVIFPDDDDGGLKVTTESPFIAETTPSDCERSCQVTPEFNPVCGSDFNNYSNIGRLKCAQMCGKRVEFIHHGNCGRSREIRPPAQRTDPVLVWS